MNSGIEIGQDITDANKNLAMRRKTRYIIYKPNADNTVIEIEKIGEREETFEDFKNSLDPTASRWCVYELEWEAADGRKMSKVIMIAYAPDNAADNG